MSLDEPGSGTLVDAKIILGAFGLTEADITPEYLKPDQASDRMRDGAMDAFFFVGGYPAGAIAELSSQHEVVMVPITGPEVDALRAEYTFFANDVLPAGTYKDVYKGQFQRCPKRKKPPLFRGTRQTLRWR